MELSNIQYYVLGKENNPMLIGYLDMFYALLKSRVELLVQEKILETHLLELCQPASRQFIMDPDTSSIIIKLYNDFQNKIHTTQESQDFAQFLVKEFHIFKNADTQDLLMNMGAKIGDTNIKLTTIDGNPFHDTSSHPDHKKNNVGVGWGEKTQGEWLEIYKKTFDLLKVVDPGFYFELNFMIKKIIPLGTAKGVHNSASYKECIGHLYMGYTIDSDFPELNNLEAIIHESSHNKLNLIMQFDPVILSDYQEIFYSPYRPDARHIHGIYIGIHAFVPVIYVMMKSILNESFTFSPFWKEKVAAYYLKNKIALKVLERYGRFTQLGNEILDEIRFLMQETDILFRRLQYSQQELIQINGAIKAHFTKVNQNYPYIKY